MKMSGMKMSLFEDDVYENIDSNRGWILWKYENNQWWSSNVLIKKYKN